MSLAAEDAVAKAKAIAAKLSGVADMSAAPVNALDVAAAAEAALASAGLGGEKRKRWGVAAEAPPVAATDNENDNGNKRSKHESQRRLWIATSSKPASHYRLYWNQHGLAIGRQVSAGEIALSLQGRGSSTTAALPGMPEQPLHLLIEGPTVESCENAEQLVEALFVAKADQTETMVDTVAAAQDPNAGGGYQASNTSLIPNQGGDHYGGGGAMMEEQIGVPNGVVGFIIGRGGESIASMQARTGCKVQIQKENEMKPGQTQRVITLQAMTKEAIDQCRSIIQGMVNERTQTSSSRDNFSGGGGGNNSQEARTKDAVQSGHVLVTVAVPDTDVGLIIGKAGSTIKGIQDRSGANIQIPQSGDADNPNIRTVSITHPHGEGASLAKQMIEDILGSKKNQSPQLTIQVEIPDKDVGMCIGRSGCVIREMQNQSGTKIQIPSFSTPGAQVRIATVVGPSDGCNKVKQMIERIVLEQSSQSVMSGVDQQGGGGGGQQYGGGGGYHQQQQGGYGGGGGGGYGQQQQQQGGYGGGGGGYGHQQQAYGQQQQQQQAAGGQQDYSKEWAAYYAAQAAQGGGAAAQPQAAAAAAPAAAAVSNGAAPAATNGTTDTTYHEQFHRYAYYYGDDAARKHYGAWSPPPGTANPYGVNPNGITAAPAAAPAQAASVAAAPAAAAPVSAAAPVANARDTGRRGVSNLPAWMTKK